MKRLLLLTAALLGTSHVAWAAVQTPIYSIVTDRGISGDDIFTWNGVTLNNTATSPTPLEGQYSMQTVSPPGSGWGVVYLQPDHVTHRAVDLSAYANGELRFFANCTTDNFDVAIEKLDGSKKTFHFVGTFPGGALNQWVTIPIPLNSIPVDYLASAFSPFEFTLNNGGTCFIDNVRYVIPPAPQADIFNVAVKDVATQSTVGSFSWPTGIAPSGWVKANQYIELQLDDMGNPSWGVQIYTNNTVNGASPKYAGPGSSNPAGLVDLNSPTQVIPLAWSIKAGTQAPTAVAPVSADPNNTGDLNSFQWIFMKDIATPTIPAQNTTIFAPGEIPVTVKNNIGIHFGQNNGDFGAENPPNYIFLEANFGAALANQTYGTSTLTIEYFTL